MSDPLRTEPSRAVDAAPDPDRDAKIEQLLLAGLDHYFAAEYEQAINVWTRALFFDRSHARARAYIERARSALAERQRESEELLQTGLAAFKRGDTDEARRLLEAAISQGAPRDEALAALDRLTRLEQRPTLPLPARGRPDGPDPAAPPARGRRWRSGTAVWAVSFGLIAATGALLVIAGPAPLAVWRRAFPLVPAAAGSPLPAERVLPIPRRSETSLARARTLAASGHLHDALVVLELGAADRSPEGRSRPAAGGHPATASQPGRHRRGRIPAGGRQLPAMKCPKCGYLGFERVERCRNCGYDFSLAEVAEVLDDPELPLRDEVTQSGRLDDLSLIDAAAHEPRASVTADLNRAPALPLPSAELPLFGGAPADDTPLITSPSAPRPPLAVRRATPEVPRVRPPAARSPMLDLATADIDQAEVAMRPSIRARTEAWPVRPAEAEPAGLAARLVAAALDLVILAAVDVLVVYFTMQICGLGLEDWAILPKAPLLAFLVVQNAGYLVVFTAGGQTLGKMALGIKVVAADEEAPLGIGPSIVRTAGVGGAGRARRPGIPHGGLQPRSPRAARPFRRNASRAGHARLTVERPPREGVAPACRCHVPRAGLRAICAGHLRLIRWPCCLGAGAPDQHRAGSRHPADVRGRHLGRRRGRAALPIDRSLAGGNRRGHGHGGHAVRAPRRLAGALAGFLLFRLFDVIKPYPANRLERIRGGFGVMADDFMAAVYANVTLRLMLFADRWLSG